MTGPALQDQVMTWGDVTLVSPNESTGPYQIEVLSEGTHFGNAEPIIEQVRSAVLDGPIVRISGYEAREVPLRIRLSANDGDQLARAQATLDVQTDPSGTPPPLVWTSPMHLAEPNVHDVLIARLYEDTDEGWDLEEILRGYRYYTLTLTCVPTVRALESTVIEALAAPTGTTPVVTPVDTCGSITNWARETNGSGATGPTAVTVGGDTAIEASAFIGADTQYLRLVRTFSSPLAVPAGQYLRVDADVSPEGGGTFKIHDGTAYRSPDLVIREAGGPTRLFFATFAASISTLKVLFDFQGMSVLPDEVFLRVFDVSYSDTLGNGDVATTRQQARSAVIAGTRPTQATIRLFSDEDAETLGGDVLVYTSSNIDWQPALRRFLATSEDPVVVASAVSGWGHSLETPSVYLIPAGDLTPGAFALMANLAASPGFGGMDLAWSARIVDENGDATIGSERVQSGEVTLEDTDRVWAMVNIADRLSLPMPQLGTTNFQVELTLTGNEGIVLDEVLLFSLDDGALTWVHDQPTASVVEVRSPTYPDINPSVWGGLSDRTVRLDYSCLSFGAHTFRPGPMQVYTLCSNAAGSQCEIEYYRRYPSHVLSADADV